MVRLADTARGVMVSILPGSGNRAYELTVHGKQVLARPGGIPLLAPGQIGWIKMRFGRMEKSICSIRILRRSTTTTITCRSMGCWIRPSGP